MNPPWLVRLLKVAPCGAVQPNAYGTTRAMNAMMAATLMDENQNSNSPYERADMRLTPVMTAINPSPTTSVGSSGIQACRILAPAISSTGTVTTQKYQYSQPATNPAHGPRPARGNSVNERRCGSATAISPNIRITSNTSVPVMR